MKSAIEAQPVIGLTFVPSSSNSSGYYRLVLERRHISFKECFPYLIVNDQAAKEGLLIHISVVSQQANILFDQLLPYLITSGLPFSIPIDTEAHHRILDGRAGLHRVGRVVNILLNDASRVGNLLQHLQQATIGLFGPFIYDTIEVGGPIYLSWGNLIQDASDLHDLSIQRTAVLSFLKTANWKNANPVSGKKLKVRTRKNKRLIHSRFVPVRILKNDPKGWVLKCIGRKGLFQIAWCVIKTGEPFQSFDETGRDIRDRLKWQFELHRRLGAKVRVPKALAFFYVKEQAWLCLEFIKGQSLSATVNALLSGNPWIAIRTEVRSSIIGLVLQLLLLVDQLHQQGYVHRDLNPENLLCTDGGRMYLVDFELCYSVKDKYPEPAFSLGTPGYMSPQQAGMMTADYSDDIYAIGAMMIKTFTGLSPTKFSCDVAEVLYTQLLHFIGDQAICRCITACLNPQAGQRPFLGEIISTVKGFDAQCRDSFPQPGSSQISMSLSDMRTTVESGLATLLSSYYTDADKIWVPQKPQLPAGAAGPFALLAQAASAGISIKGDEEVFDRNLAVLKIHAERIEGLSELAIDRHDLRVLITCLELKKAGLIHCGIEDVADRKLSRSLFQECRTLKDLMETGQLLLRYQRLRPVGVAENLLTDIEEQLIGSQNENGSWYAHDGTGPGNKSVFYGYQNGMAGILSWMISTVFLTGNACADRAIHKGLAFLIKHSRRNAGRLTWPVSSRIPETDVWFARGITGIAYTFLQAYERYRLPRYKEIAINTLLIHPCTIASNFGSFAFGLSGLGEVYLEAYQTFGDKRWMERAVHIAQYFRHTGQEINGYRFWEADAPEQRDSSMFSGHAGIVHFLLRLADPDTMSFPVFN